MSEGAPSSANNTDAWATYYKQLQEHQQKVAAYQVAQQQQQYAQQQQQQQYAQYAQQYAQQAYAQRYQQAYAQQMAQQQSQRAQQANPSPAAAAAAAASAVGAVGVAGAAPGAARAPGAAAGGSAYNSYSTYYGSSVNDSNWTQQQAGSVIGATPNAAGVVGAAAAARQQAAAAQPTTTASAARAAFAQTAARLGIGAGAQQIKPPVLWRPPAAAAGPAPAQGAAGPDGWPPTLRKWVERAFAACKSDAERAIVERNLRLVIARANEQGALWSVDWDACPLPERFERQQSPPRDGWRGGESRLSDFYHGSSESSYDPQSPQKLSNRAAKKAAAQAKKRKTAGVSFGGRRDSFDPEDEGNFHRPVDAMEVAKRARRAGRFEASGTSLAERVDRWAQAPAHRLEVDADGDITLDYTVVGTSQTLEKKYLRLTSAPDPRTVRPEPVLQKAIEMVREKMESFGDERGQTEYIYQWEQMKSIRQDLTVQRIRNAFTVQVYEMHARICLEFGDMTEFNQCQAQLTQLYEESIGTVTGQREFTAYNILYNVGKGAANNVNNLMLTLTSEDREDALIRFALQVSSGPSHDARFVRARRSG